MDKIDLRILSILEKDSNTPIKVISNKLNLSVTPIYERIKKLEKRKIIKKYVALIDYQKLDASIKVLINITIKNHDKEMRNLFVKNVMKLDQINELHHTSGSFDFVATAMFFSIVEYKDFLISKLSSIPNIQDIESQIVLETHKDEKSIVQRKSIITN